MSTWSDGYVSDINYTYGYYTELNPNRVVLPFLKAGLAVPKMGAACELGFGQGVSINAHAAASRTSWWGTDFNPAHVGFAQELAEQAGSVCMWWIRPLVSFVVAAIYPILTLLVYTVFGRGSRMKIGVFWSTSFAENSKSAVCYTLAITLCPAGLQRVRFDT